MLKLKLLGELNIELDGKAITDKVSSKSIAILALLFSHENHQLSRRELMDYLWPDSGEDAAKYNLRFNLWQMKKLFNREDSDESFLLVTRDFCAINSDYPYQCDFCDIQETNPEEENSVKKLERIYSLFTGDFLENQYFAGCADLEEMMIMQRYSLETKKMHFLKKLIAAYYKEGKDVSCLKALASCEEMDPYDEDNARIRIELLVKAGKYSDAIHYYQRFFSKLASDIGVEPSAELKECAGRIRKLGVGGNSGGFVKISARAMKHVECYWMADVIRELLDMEDFCAEDYLDDEQISDLAYIQHRLGSCNQIPSMARIVDGFLKLIFGICQRGQCLEFDVGEPERLDPVSADVVKMLMDNGNSRLRVLCR